jgi:hypothetical protein
VSRKDFYVALRGWRGKTNGTMKISRVKGFASRGFACYHSDDED